MRLQNRKIMPIDETMQLENERKRREKLTVKPRKRGKEAAFSFP